MGRIDHGGVVHSIFIKSQLQIGQVRRLDQDRPRERLAQPGDIDLEVCQAAGAAQDQVGVFQVRQVIAGA